MKITYNFVNGESAEVEVDEKWGEILQEMDREEASRERLQRMHETRVNHQMDCCNLFALNVPDEAEQELAYEIEKAIYSLNEEQIDLIGCLYGADNMTERQYAEIKGISPAAVHYRKKVIMNKLEKFNK